MTFINSSITFHAKPLSKEYPLRFQNPETALVYRQIEHKSSASKKHFHLTLPVIPSSIVPLVEIEVQDGSYHKFKVQVISNKSNANIHWYQCDCDEFIEDESGMCEHIACIINVTENIYTYQQGQDLTTSNLLRSWISRYRELILNSLEGRKKFTVRFYDSYKNEIQKLPAILSRFREENNISIWESCTLDNELLVKKLTEISENNNFEELRNSFSSEGLMKNDLNLYDYQEEIFKSLLAAKKAICCISMGGGKTFTILNCLGYVTKKLNRVPKTLIVCPKSIKNQWKIESLRGVGLDCEFIDNQKSLLKLGKTNIHIITYQLFTRMTSYFESAGYEFVIMDEIQFIRNEEAKVWKAAKKLKNVEYFYGLSGTIIENKLDDLFAVMDVIAPGKLGPKWKFADQFQNLASITRKTIVYNGIKNEDKLHELIKYCVFSYSDMKLPPITHHFISVGMNKTQREAHDNYYGEAKKLLAKSMTSGLNYYEKSLLQSYLLKARQSCNSETLITKKPSQRSPKMIEVLNLLNNLCLNKNQKVVIFSQWTEMLDIIADELNSINLKYVYFTGRETEKKRIY